MRRLFAENHHLGQNFPEQHHISYVLHLETPCYIPTRSGTQYHLRDPISEMDPNIVSTVKLLEVLFTRFSNVKKQLEMFRPTRT